MSLTRDDIATVQDGGHVALTLEGGDVTVEAVLETDTRIDKFDRKPNVTNVMGTSEPVSPNDVDGLNIDLETTQVSPSVRFSSSSDTLNVETATLAVVTEVADAEHPHTNTDIWTDDRHTVREFELTGAESAE